MKYFKTFSLNAARILFALAIALGAVGQITPVQPARAATALSVTPITWNVIGLDSNNVAVGPNHFPVGARVCSDSATSATVTFNWDDGLNKYTGGTYINLRGGTLDVVTLTFAASGCKDAYFEVEVKRDSNAYNKTRAYSISATAGSSTETTPQPRELFVEHLISQNRNWVKDIKLDGVSVPMGGTMNLLVGQTYNITINGATATQGYNQLEEFINFPNKIFQVLSVSTTYSAHSDPGYSNPSTKLYGDACTWENDPNSPNYRSCVGSDYKNGGDVDITYTVKILQVPGAPLVNPEPLHTLIYDFSGSSYHYNADFSVSTVYSKIETAQIKKSFKPNAINPDGISTLTIDIPNPSSVTLSGVNFKDNLPTISSGTGVMKVAATPNASTSGCGTPTFSPAAEATTLSFTGATIAAGATCTIKVDVTANLAGSYTNNTNNLFLNGTSTVETGDDTGSYASAVLTVGDAPPTPAPSCNTELAVWEFSNGTSTAYTRKSSAVTGTPQETASGHASIIVSTTDGVPVNSWIGTGNYAAKNVTPPSGSYFQFAADTTNFTDVSIVFDYKMTGNWAAGSDNHQYVYSSTDGSTFTQITTATLTNPPKSAWTTHYPAKANTTNTNGSTYFRIYADGEQQSTAAITLDNVAIIGCRVLNPPEITKAYTTSPIAVGTSTTPSSDTSTLTFTLKNPNTGHTSTLSGIDFNDYLPVKTLDGNISVTNGSAVVTGTGTSFLSQLAVGSVINIPSTPVAMSGTVAINKGEYIVTASDNIFSSGMAGQRIFINAMPYTVGEYIDPTHIVLANDFKEAGITSGGTISAYTKYTVASIASNTFMMLTGNYAGTTSSSQTLSAGHTFASAATTTCRGTLINVADQGALSLSGDRAKGLVTLSTGATNNVTGTGTDFQNQFKVGSRIMVNGKNYRITAIAASPTQTMTVTPTPSAAVSNAVYFFGKNLSGTVSVTNGSAAVTGSGTAFTSEIAPGDVIYINGVRVTVATTGTPITDDAHLNLSANWAQAGGSGLPIDANRILRGTVSLTNNSANVTSTGTYFTQELATGMTVYINGNVYKITSIASDSGTNSATINPVANGSATNVDISTNGRLGLAGGGTSTCTVTASVKANVAGSLTNVSTKIEAIESGPNNTPTGYATATLDAIVPPVISKIFSPNPILTGGTSTLTFTLVNPNPSTSLSAVAFSDTFPTSPANMVVAALTGASTNGCGTPTYSPTAGAGSISFTAGTIAAGETCTVKVNVTAPTVTGNLSGTLSVTNGSYDVTGSGTNFDPEVTAGSTIYINGTPYLVGYRAPGDDANLKLTTPYAGATASGLTVPSGYFNISGNVSHQIHGSTFNGNKASDTLMVETASPAIAFKKYIAVDATGCSTNLSTDTCKWKDVSVAVPVGAQVWYKFVAENTGDIVFTSFTFTDDKLAGGDRCRTVNNWSSTSLPVASPTSDPTSVCITGPGSAIAASPSTLTNTASVTGTYNDGSDKTLTSNDDPAAYNVAKLTLAKSVTPTYYTAVGDKLTYSFLVTNSGSASLMGPVTVSDDKSSDESCPAVSTVGDGDNWFDPDEIMTCTSTYTVVSDNIGKGISITNEADATAYLDSQATTPIVSNKDTETVYQPAVIGDYVWLDRVVNGIANGTQDTDEPGIEGVTVNLLYSNGSPTGFTSITDHNGAYRFTNVVPGTYIVEFIKSGASFTTQGSDRTTLSTDSDADTTTGRVTITVVSGETNNGIDAGFAATRMDLDDLPNNYSTIFSPGPAHILFPDANSDGVPETTNGVPAVWLGTAVGSEADGKPQPHAQLDTLDDGFIPLSTTGWVANAKKTFRVTLNSSVIGTDTNVSCRFWIDWNPTVTPQYTFDNPSYDCSGITHSPEPVDVEVTVPSDFTGGDIFVRVRNSLTTVTAADYTGTMVNGEVEGYWYNINGGNLTPVTLSYFTTKKQGSNVVFTWSTATETGNVGFNLYVADGDKKTLVNSALIPSKVIDSLERQDYTYTAAVKGNTYYIEDVSILGEAKLHGPYQLGKAYGSQLTAEKINWAAINAEHNGKFVQQQKAVVQGMKVPQSALAPVAPSSRITINGANGKPAKTATPKPSATLAPTATQTLVPTATNTVPPTATETLTVAPTGTDVPTLEPTATEIPMAEPTATEVPTLEPTATEIPTATAVPTLEPTATATAVPTALPGVAVVYDPANLQLVNTFNMKVNKTGIYRVTYEMLKNAGLDLAGVAVEKLTVLNRNLMVPVYVYMPENGQAFGAGGYIEFYGEALDTIYTDTNVYTVQVYASPAPRVGEISAVPGVGETAASYEYTLVVNNQKSYLNTSPGSDPWYEKAMGVTTSLKNYDFSVTVQGLADSGAPTRLELVVVGYTSNTAVAPDHHLQVSMNGFLVADKLFDGTSEQRFAIDLAGGVLREGVNTLRLTLPADSGAPNEIQLLDQYKVTYPRRYETQNGSLGFSASGSNFNVTNLTGPNVIVYRVNKNGNMRLTGLEVSAGSGYNARFAGSAEKETYEVTTAELVNVPVLEANRVAVELNRRADYLIIAHPDFISGLQPLIAAKEAQGLRVSVVDVKDLYAQYSYGIFDPIAIKDYVAYAVKQLGVKYVLLVGGDTYDYRNYKGLNSISFIPSLYTATGGLAKVIPADPMYADANGDNVPEVALGRFPVRSTAELGMLVNKTLAYGSKTYGQTAVFVSDKDDGIVNFKGISEQLMGGIPGSWNSAGINLDDVSVTVAKANLLSAMNNGTALVTFVGHSGPQAWTFNNLFTNTDAAGLTNVGKPFVVVQWGCWNTYYVDPANTYMVQKFLFSGDNGAVAVLGATTLADSNSEAMLGTLLTPRMVMGGVPLGIALRDAKLELAQAHPELADVLLGITLMGDPALVVQP